MSGQRLAIAVLAAVAAAHAAPARAQQPAAGQVEELPRIRITDPNRDLLKVALPNVVGDADQARQAAEIQKRDFEVSGLFRLIDPASFPPALQQEGLGFSSANWSTVGAQAVVKLQARRDGIEGRLYQVGRGENAILTKTYRGAALRPLVHQWVNDIIGHFTGQRGVFGVRIAFAQTGRSGEVASVGLDGAEVAVLTKMQSECLLPAYSPTGREIAFTSFLMGGADLWVVPATGGRANRISKRSGMNSGAAWFSDGASMAVTLSHEGNPEIYRISRTGDVVSRLTRSNASDLSPSISPDGGQIAFVSDRQGTPQIFVMSASGGSPKRLTFQGGQNTTPRWNPRADKPVIAFTGRDERHTFDIFIFDTRTNKIERVTQNQGSNMDPAWAPDGRLLVYASSRGGLFAFNPETRIETQIYRGGARAPSFGPPPQPGR